MIAASRFLIVEDELLIAETISDFLKAEGCFEIVIVESVNEAIEQLNSSKIDFVLTDIALGDEKSGIDLGSLLHTRYKLPFIYITSHADKAMIDKAKHTHPSAYILKPFKKEDLLIAIELCLFSATRNIQKQSDEEELIIKDGRAMVRLYHSNILWLEADGNYTSIHLTGNERRVVRTTLSDLEEQLSSPNFVRIHKSFVVNKKHVTEIKSTSLIINDQELTVGRTYQANLSEIFN
jgi:DNA-binding LytR/AlgR family response regulator